MNEHELLNALRLNLGRVIRGKDEAIELLVVALLTRGHVLIEDVPGVGKTTLAKALAKSIDGRFHRIQFTPDLLPADIVGGMVYSQKSGEFDFRPGPVFCHILLADEINRASPRTQSALLEAMNERQVTIEGDTHTLPEPFIVIATQNPVEYHGTYPLPEAQLDRFAMKLNLGYPSAPDELAVMLDQRSGHPLEGISPVLGVSDVVELSRRVESVAVEQSVAGYMLELVRATRIDPRVRLGSSPRGALVMYRGCQALAFLRGRDYVLPDDVKYLAGAVLGHRLVLDSKTRHKGGSERAIVDELLQSLTVPA